MKTRDWLLKNLINAATNEAQTNLLYTRRELETAKEEVLTLKQRISDLAPQKQFRVMEGAVSGPAAQRTISSVYSTNGVTTITL